MIHLIKMEEFKFGLSHYQNRILWPMIYLNNAWFIFCLTMFEGSLEDLKIGS
jgi:hypothetical protein